MNSVAAAAAALERLGGALGDDFDRAAEMLIGIGEGKVVTLGVGKSGHAAEKVAGTLRSIGVPASYLSSLDALHGDIGFVGPDDVGLLFSKSGTTRELTTILPHLRARGMRLIAIVGAPDSPLGRDCDLALDASVEREGCPLDSAPMASVIAAQAMGDALAAAVMQGRGFDRDDFARLHPAGALGARLNLTVNDVMRSGSDLPSVVAGASLKDAIIEISRAGYGAVCVLHTDGRLAGFVTDGDIRRRAARGRRPQRNAGGRPHVLQPADGLARAAAVAGAGAAGAAQEGVPDRTGRGRRRLRRPAAPARRRAGPPPGLSDQSPGIGTGGFTLIAGPCVIESRELVFEVAGKPGPRPARTWAST